MIRALTSFFLFLYFVLPAISAAADFDHGNHSESLESLKKSLYQDPSSKEKKNKLAVYYLVMGREKVKKGKYEEALVLLEEGGNLAPEEWEFYFLKGLSYFLMKRLYEAESELIKIAYDEAATADPLKLLGRVYYDRADLDAALELSTAAGWNQTAGDWELVLALAQGHDVSIVVHDTAQTICGSPWHR